MDLFVASNVKINTLNLDQADCLTRHTDYLSVLPYNVLGGCTVINIVALLVVGLSHLAHKNLTLSIPRSFPRAICSGTTDTRDKTDSNENAVNQCRIGYWHQRVDERHGNPPPR